MNRILRRSLLLVSLLLTASVSAQSQLPAILTHFKEHAADYKIQPSDVAQLELVSEAPSKAAGVIHVYVRQLVNGIPVSNGLATVTLKDGKVLRVASRLKANLSIAPAQPALTAEQAVQSAAAQLGLRYSGALQPISADKAAQEYVFRNNELSTEKIPVRLMYTVTNDHALVLSWDLSIASTTTENWWSVRISAADGSLLERSDWVRQCEFDQCEEEAHNHAAKPALQPLLPPPPPGADQYNVYPLPVESPNHGDRALLVNPSDPIASPFGWHDTNGTTGDEFTITRGNNVHASEDIGDADVPGYSPDGTAALNFDFSYDSAVGVQGNLNAVITNLFYMNNMMHDIWHYYGFDEASGNFQQLNYSGDGFGSDYVFADAQDGSGTNNANFGTPPDGDNPRMQMYLWSENNAPDILTINSPSTIDGSYTSTVAGFSPPIPTVPITENIILVNDGTGDATDGCQTILNSDDIVGKIALVRRGSCTFGEKVEACQLAGASAVIVMNNVGGTPIAMGGTSSATIPSIMISQSDGNLFVTSINNGFTINGTIVSSNDISATDSDLDNMIIAHEYGHGISTRLTGGAANSDCLNNAEQMGEGWSDWFGLMLTIEPGDQGTDRRGVGTYVTNQLTTGTGIRPAPYSTSFTINNYTYGATNNTGTISEPHGIGFVWATMLWDLNWALIDEYGFDPNVKTGTGGNNKAMALVIEGLKLQPCGPGFVDGRDAILAADELLNGGVNECLIWEVFAKRGLGFSADQGDANFRDDQTQAFDLPPGCISNLGIGENGLDRVSIYPNPAKDQLHIDMSGYSNVQSVRIVDLQGKVLYETASISAFILTVDLSQWKSGMYLVQLTDVNGAKAVEIVKH